MCKVEVKIIYLLSTHLMLFLFQNSLLLFFPSEHKYIMNYCIVLYCTVPYCIVLYCIIVTDRSVSLTSQSLCTPSPDSWLNTPAPHEHPHQDCYLSTHLTALQCLVSFVRYGHVMLPQRLTCLPTSIVYLPPVSSPACVQLLYSNICFFQRF